MDTSQWTVRCAGCGLVRSWDNRAHDCPNPVRLEDALDVLMAASAERDRDRVCVCEETAGYRVRNADCSVHEGALNMWGTLKSDVGEGFCPDCEREEPRHYQGCPRHGRSGPLAWY